MIDDPLPISLDDLGTVYRDGWIILGQVHHQLALAPKAISQRVQFPIKKQPPLVNDQHPLAQFFHVGAVVGGQNDRRAALLIDMQDELADALLGHHVQANGRFVQKEQGWIVE